MAAIHLEWGISDMFSSHTRNCTWNDYERNYSLKRKYIEIPINNDVFDVPVFAVNTFNDLVLNREQTDAIIASLYTKNRIPRFKSLERYMQDMLVQRFDDTRLVKLTVKQKEDTIIYYGTHGAVFNSNFLPMMLALWRIQKFQNDEGKLVYKFLEPVIHINPTCLTDQSDPMQRFLLKKLATISLFSKVEAPYPSDNTGQFIEEDSERNKKHNIKIEICKNPFVIKTSDVPSFSTSTQSLLQLAMQHIDEAM